MATLGILGGGQLARMTLQAASRLGIDVVIAERFAESPAARLCSRSVVFPHGWDDDARLDELATLVDAVTLESEFVDFRVLQSLEQHGLHVRPDSACVRVVQDKLLQKQALARAELPVPPFSRVDTPDDISRAAQDFGWPLMLKARRDGYDGRGNVVVHGTDDAEAACSKLGWPQRELFAEGFVEFERELASLVVRGLDGNVAQYPLVETIQDPELHICREVLAPADIPSATARHAQTIAAGAVEAVGGTGAFGIELFLLSDGQLLVNELAPRPHNSAHYTIEACWTSQFENHARAVLGLPLGDPGLRANAAVMVNLLGTGTQPLDEGSLAAALGEPRAFVHLYGKADNRPGRKMGHVTALGDTLDEARARASTTAGLIHL